MSVASLTGGTPTRRRTWLSGGRMDRSTAPRSSGRSRRSRNRPGTPRAGASPGPNGGTPRPGNGAGQGRNDAHGKPDAAAAAGAPQQLVSPTSRSGAEPATAARRSSGSNSAPRTKTAVERLSEPTGERD